jgi:hypothetical protein
MKFILPTIIVCVAILSIIGSQSSFATPIAKLLVCDHDANLCPNGNFTLQFPIITGVQATLHYGDCADGQVQTYQLSNHTWICGANGGVDTDNFLTSINSDTTAAQVFSGTANNVTITDTGAGTLQWNLGSNVVVTNGLNQTISKAFTFVAGNTLTTPQNSKWSGLNIGTATADVSSPRQGDIRIIGSSVKFNDNTNTTQTITPSSYLTTAVTSATGTANNVTVSASTGAVTWNLGSNVVMTQGTAQTFTKAMSFSSGNKLTLTPSSATSGITIGTLSANPTSPRQGDLWIAGTTLKYNDNSNTTQSVTLNGLTAAVTSLNSDTTAAQVIAGQATNITLGESGATHTLKLGTNIPVLGGSAQTFTKAVTFSSGNKLTVTPSSATSGFTLGTLGADPTSPRQGDQWINGALLKFNDNSNTTQTADILSQAQTFTGKKTGTPTSSTASFNLGTTASYQTSPRQGDLSIAGTTLIYNDNSNATQTVAILGTAQTFLAKITHTPTASTASFNLGTLSASPTSPRQGDMWITGASLAYNDNNNSTKTVDTLNTANTLSGAKTFTGANLVTTGSFSYTVTANSLKLCSGCTTFRNPAGTFGYSITGSAITANRTLTLPLTTQTETIAVQPTINFTSPTAPTTTTSTTGVMSNLLATITPAVTGRVEITVCLNAASGTGGDGAKFDIRIGTTLLAQDAAIGNTLIGTAKNMISATAGHTYGICNTVQKTGLAIGTKEFIQIGKYAVTGGTVTWSNFDVSVREL